MEGHTGTHPVTESTCDDPNCWCHLPYPNMTQKKLPDTNEIMTLRLDEEETLVCQMASRLLAASISRDERPYYLSTSQAVKDAYYIIDDMLKQQDDRKLNRLIRYQEITRGR